MSRVITPNRFLEQLTLLKNIKAKHDLDGPASVLLPYLLQQEIDLNVLAAIATAALARDESRQTCQSEKEKNRELRDVKFGPVMKRLRAEVQFLKNLFSDNVHELGNWGITVNGKGRIVYPASIEKRAVVFANFKTKHETYPVGSRPLQVYLDLHGIDMAADSVLVGEALDRHEDFMKAAKNEEQETELRNKIWKPVVGELRGVANYLKKLFTGNTQALGDWGFVVNSSPKKHHERTTRLRPKMKRRVRSVIRGSLFKNLGATELHLYGGKKGASVPLIVPPETEVKLPRGYSSLTVFNTSMNDFGKHKVILSQ
ncbi:MAG: hypothetical protein IPP77_08820 [Bacteroidetes bacterium]|nr:hypothetical protein [Bacteroidota bacterium]